jgi:hypothetical protein
MYSLLTVIYHHVVIVMSVGALRMYRGLVDSTALNSTVVAEPPFSSKGLSTKSDIQFAIPSESHLYREEGKDMRSGTGGAALDPSYLASSPQRIVLITEQNDGSLEGEAV